MAGAGTPVLPVGVLPKDRDVRAGSAIVIGADAAGFAMAALAVSAASTRRDQAAGDGAFSKSPEVGAPLVALVGDPSVKKTPIIDATCAR